MSDDWADPPENEGITLGPEEALERETARSKALKVERLKLRDQVETLEAEVRRLEAENSALRKQPEPTPSAKNSGAYAGGRTHASPPLQLPAKEVFLLLFFNIAALSLLLYLILRG